MTQGEAIKLAVEALKAQGQKLAPEANMYTFLKGNGSPSLEIAWKKRLKIKAAVAVLEPLGERSGPSRTDKITRNNQGKPEK